MVTLILVNDPRLLH